MVATISRSIAGPTGGPGTQVQFAAGRSGFGQLVSLTAGQRYTISVQYQQAGTTVVPWQFDYWDGGSTDTYSQNFTPTPAWQTASYTVTGYTSPPNSALSILNNTSQVAGLVNFYGFKIEAGEVATGYNDPSLQTSTFQPNTNLWPTQDLSQFILQSGTVVGTTVGEATGTTGTTIAFTTDRSAFILPISSFAAALTAGQVYTVSVRYKLVGTAVPTFEWNYWDGNSTDNYSAVQVPTNSWQVATHTFTAYTNPAAGTSLALVNNATPRVAGQIEVYGFKLEAGPIATAYVDPTLPAPAIAGAGVLPQPAVTPTPISGLGYTMVYSDSFFANPLTDGAWIDGNWKVAKIASASNLVWNGSSTVDLTVDSTTSTTTLTTASITDMKAGYFEITAKWSGDPAQVISLSLLSDQHNNYNNTGALSDCYPNAPNGNTYEAWGQWDIIKWSPSLYGTGKFITQATQHWSQVNGVCSPATGEQFDKPASNSGTQVMGQNVGSGNVVSAPNIDVTQFHTYSLLWQAGTPSGTLSWYIDGTLVTKVVLASNLVFPSGVTYTNVIEQQPYFFALTNSLNGAPSTTPQHLTVSSVRYWQILPTPLPTASAFSFNATSGVAVVLDIAARNSGETVVSCAVGSPPAHGTATVNGTKITYTSTSTYSGSDSFTYTVANAGGTSAAATVSATVAASSPKGLPYMVGAKGGAVVFNTDALSFLNRKLDCQGCTIQTNAFIGKETLPSNQILTGVAFPMLSNWVGSSPSWDGGNLLDLSQGASGGYNSAYQAMANALRDCGNQIGSVRPGWEMSGNWYPWTITNSTGSTFANYIATFRNIVTILRNTIPNVKIEFCFSWARGSVDYDTDPSGRKYPGTTNPLNYWPGDSYVDIISCDFYEANIGGNWQTVQTAFYGPDWMVNYARAHGQLVALSEYAAGDGRAGVNAYLPNGQPGLNDGQWVADSVAWMNSLGSLFAYSNWGNDPPADDIWSVGANPAEQQAWINAWYGTHYAGTWWGGAAPPSVSG